MQIAVPSRQARANEHEEARLFVPANPGWRPRLLGRSLEASDVFPFSAERTYWYLLGRGALRNGLASLGITGEVLVPAYNHGVEVSTLVAAGLKPVFYPVDRDMQYDPEVVQSMVTSETRAVYVTHFWGFPQSLAPLASFCRSEGLALIEDCALSLFASSDGAPVGSVGDMSIFSLHKTLGVSHSGLLALNRAPIVEPATPERPTLRWATRGAVRRLSSRLDIAFPSLGRARRRRPGASVGEARAQEERGHGWEEFEPEAMTMGPNALVQYIAAHEDARRTVERRRHNYQRLASQLPADRLWLPELPDGACPLFAPVYVNAKVAAVEFLGRRGIEAVPVWLDAPSQVPAGAFPDADYLRAHLLEVPCHQDLDDREMDYVAGALALAFEQGL